MEKQICPLYEVFNFNTGFFQRALEGITDDETLKIIDENSNTMLWIAGHLITSRCNVLKLCGSSLDSPYYEYFKKGTKLQSGIKYPSIKTLVDEWIQLSYIMTAELKKLHESDLNKPSPFKLPVSENNIINCIGFLLMHESYHIGQLGYIRRILGKKWEV